jgi:hypothetical protein
MRRLFKNLVIVLSLVAVAGCGESASNSTPDDDGGAGGAGGGGKGDAICTLEDDDPRSPVRFVNEDHAQTRCQGATGFVPTFCCEEEILAYEELSGCPAQAKWNDAEGNARRCAGDTADTDGGAFVPTACCQPLCAADAQWREQENGRRCVNGEGQFENNVCCNLADDDICEASDFDAELALDQRHHCRDGRTGRFAPAVCCIDRCFDAALAGGKLPVACTISVEDECVGAAENAAGLCYNEDNGRFVKAACCTLAAADADVEDPAEEDDDFAQIADDAFICENINDEVIHCESGDDEACAIKQTALEDPDFFDGCCAIAQDELFEFCPQ